MGPRNARRLPLTEGLLDANRLLAHACASDAGDIATARLPSAGLERAAGAEELRAFEHLVHLDVAGNALPLEAVAGLWRLEVLEMGLNGVEGVELPRGAFRHLSILDLSYNRLTHEALLQLRGLPALSSLDVSGNGLRSLPVAMSGALPSGQPHFARLQNLVADDNALRSPGVFQALAGLPQLQYLSLNRNRIGFVPRLIADAGEEGVAFGALRVLGLAQNRVAATSDVLELAGWPALEAVHLWGNPLCTRRSALPPELALAMERAGIEVARREPPPPPKPSVALSPDRLCRVRSEPLPPIAPAQYLEYTTNRPASTAGLLPEPEEPAESFFMTEAAEPEVKLRTPRNPHLPPFSRGTEGEALPPYFGDEFALREARRLGIATPVGQREEEPLDAGDFSLLFAGEAEAAPELPRGLGAQTRALKFALEHPLVFVDAGAGGQPPPPPPPPPPRVRREREPELEELLKSVGASYEAEMRRAVEGGV